MSTVAYYQTGINNKQFNLVASFYMDDAAIGEESETILTQFNQTAKHFVNPMSRYLDSDEIKFLTLKNKWEEETNFLSSMSDICSHPAYQQIIGMGKSVIPYIFAELDERPNLWFWALKAITGVDPIPANKRGRILEMSKIWLLWWSKNKNKYE